MALAGQKILFFIAGISPTNVEQDLITQLENQDAVVGVRTLLQIATYGAAARAEAADGVAIAPGNSLVAPYDDAEDFPVVTPAAHGFTASVANGATVVVNNSVGTKQKETVTAAGTITTGGLATVTVTSALLEDPVVVSFAVIVGDTAPVWAGKARTALADTLAIIAHFTVSGSTTAIVLEALLPAANDGTFNVATADDTSAGVTEVATSTHTTAGAAIGKSDNATARVADGVVAVVLPSTQCVIGATQVVEGVTVTGTGTTATFTVAAGVVTAVALA